MFRGVRDLAGLIIDIDSFPEPRLQDWDEIASLKKSLFITSSKARAVVIRETLPKSIVRVIPDNRDVIGTIFFLREYLDQMGLRVTQVAVVTADQGFIPKLSQYYIGNILVSNTLYPYDRLSISPDIQIRNPEALKSCLQKRYLGLRGELISSPYAREEDSGSDVLQSVLKTDHGEAHLIASGRYFPTKHYAHIIHPLTARILHDKEVGGKEESTFHEKILFETYDRILKRILKYWSSGTICLSRVPPRPNQIDRFKQRVVGLSKANGILDETSSVRCIRDFESQKQMTTLDERRRNVRGAFEASSSIRGKKVILLDDIISTGMTASACVDTLLEAGAEAVLVLVLAVNQLGSYWKYQFPTLHCSRCGQPMKLLASSNGGYQYFCSLYQICRTKMDYEDGYVQIMKQVEEEFRMDVTRETIDL